MISLATLLFLRARTVRTSSSGLSSTRRIRLFFIVRLHARPGGRAFERSDRERSSSRVFANDGCDTVGETTGREFHFSRNGGGSQGGRAGLRIGSQLRRRGSRRLAGGHSC